MTININPVDPMDALFASRHGRERLPEGTLTQTLAAVKSTLASERERGLVGRLVSTVVNRLGLDRDAVAAPLDEVVDPGPVAVRVAYARALVRGGQALFRRGSTVVTVLNGQFVATVPGDNIASQASTVVVGMHQGQTAELAPGTIAALTLFAAGAAGKLVELKLSIGRALATINNPLVAGDFFGVATPGAAATARGTEFIAEARSETESFFATLHGVIGVKMGDQEISLEAGQQVRATEGAVLTPEPIPDFVPVVPEPAPPGRMKAPSDVLIHAAQAGENLLIISQRFGVSLADLLRANPGLPVALYLTRGTLVVIPRRRTG